MLHGKLAYWSGYGERIRKMRIGLICGTQGGVGYDTVNSMTPREIMEIYDDLVEFQAEEREAMNRGR